MDCFARAIRQSTPSTYFTPQLATAISTTIADQVTIADLAQIPPRALTDTTDVVIATMPELIGAWDPMALGPTPF